MQKDPMDIRTNELRKQISLLEWDLPNMKNSKMRVLKENRLVQFKKELKELLNGNESS